MSSQALPTAPARHATWRERRLRVDGGFSVAVFESGRDDADAPVLVLVHGMGHWTQAAWDRVAPGFAETHRVVAFDLPGFGASDRPRARYTLPFFTKVLDAVVRDTRAATVALAGHSLGGLIVADYAARRPRSVRALTLVDPAGFLRTPKLALRIMGSRPVIALMRSIKPSRAFVIRTLERAVFDRTVFTDGERERAVALSSDPAVVRAFFSVYAGALHEMIHMKKLHARFATWRGPTLLVWGRQDRFVPFRGLATAREVYPSASVLAIDRCGHCPTIEYPELVIERMRALDR